MTEQLLKITVHAEIPALPERIYNAWLSGTEHAAMTGVPATAGTKVGDAFTAHGDYISGKNMELVPFCKIVQSWRTTEFEEEDEDSVLEVLLQDKGAYTLLTLTHYHLPPHGEQYKQGWVDYYFKPMIAYFTKAK